MIQLTVTVNPQTNQMQIQSNLNDSAHVLLLLERVKLQLLQQPHPALDQPPAVATPSPMQVAHLLRNGK